MGRDIERVKIKEAGEPKKSREESGRETSRASLLLFYLRGRISILASASSLLQRCLWLLDASGRRQNFAREESDSSDDFERRTARPGRVRGSRQIASNPIVLSISWHSNLMWVKIRSLALGWCRNPISLAFVDEKRRDTRRVELIDEVVLSSLTSFLFVSTVTQAGRSLYYILRIHFLHLSSFRFAWICRTREDPKHLI